MALDVGCFCKSGSGIPINRCLPGFVPATHFPFDISPALPHASPCMKLFTRVSLILSLAAPLHAGDTLVQVSTIDALIKGIYDGGVSFGDL